jgi:hypothetical protein
VSYQPEERYWTDYLRIALPVVGLLLMLGLFWFWANSLIGDDDSNDQPTNTPVVSLNETPVTAATNTPIPTTNAAINPTQGSDRPSPTPEEGGEQQAEPTPTEEAEEPAGEGRFAEGDTVVVTEDDVNLRPSASTAEDAVTVLTAGTALEITGPPEEGGDFTWWPVTVVDTGDVGYVVDDFIAPSEE